MTYYVLDIINDLSPFFFVYFCNYRHVLISVSLLQAQIKEKARKIELLEAEQDLLTKRNTYRLKVIQELVEKSKEQDEQLKRVDKYKQEKKQYESKVKNLKSEISNLNTKLGTTTAATKEREAAISDMNKKLKGVSKTKEIINVCLTEASISIRAALGMQYIYRAFNHFNSQLCYFS